jgi:hypothetical protein
MKQFSLIIILFIAIAIHAMRSNVYAQTKMKVVIKYSIGSFTLDGSKSYDPNKNGRIVSYAWRKVKGGKCNIVSPNAAVTVVNEIEKGDYEFQLKVVSNFKLSGFDSTSIIVNVQ